VPLYVPDFSMRCWFSESSANMPDKDPAWTRPTKCPRMSFSEQPPHVDACKVSLAAKANVAIGEIRLAMPMSRKAQALTPPILSAFSYSC
jgi:hypothetical protein